MTDPTPPADGQPKLVHAFRTMPGWKVKVVVVALIVGVLGVGGQVAARVLRTPTPAVQTTTTHVVPAPSSGVGPPGSSSFAGGGDPSVPTQVTTTVTDGPAPAAPPTLTDQVTPFMAKFGFSFVVGLVLGVVFRTFLGFAAMLTALLVAIALGLNHFGVINLDLDAVKSQSGQVSSWITEQGMHLKDLIFAHLPSAGAAGAGFLIGMKRR